MITENTARMNELFHLGLKEEYLKETVEFRAIDIAYRLDEVGADKTVFVTKDAANIIDRDHLHRNADGNVERYGYLFVICKHEKQLPRTILFISETHGLSGSACDIVHFALGGGLEVGNVCHAKTWDGYVARVIENGNWYIDGLPCLNIRNDVAEHFGRPIPNFRHEDVE